MSPLLAGLVAGAYLLGSIPFGLLIARVFAKVDVREEGSGNIGATNVARTAGKGLGAVTLLLDAGKGLVPVLVASSVADAHTEAPTLWIALCGFAAVIGHCFPITLRFRGGKGVATAFGVFLGTAPVAALAGFGIWGTIYALTRVSSIGSLLAAVVVPAVVWVAYDRTLFYLALAVTLVVVARHHGNIRRIIARVEEQV